MDFSILHNNSIRIRTKRASFVVDPVKSISKTNADAVILLDKEVVDLSRVEDHRVVLQGEGEYEVKNVKISGIGVGDGFVYSIFADNLALVLGKVSKILEIKDRDMDCQIALLNVDGQLQSIAAKLAPGIVILYGEKKIEGAKELGRESINLVQKFTSTKEKLPGEMEVVVLG